MSNTRITLACRNYDRTQAIIRGLVKIPGIDLHVIEMSDVPKMFTGLFKGEFDASEMSLAELVYYASRNQNDFIGIPVFPSRMFRHGFLFYNTASGIRSPGDLAGKRIGFPRLTQTACIWIRGILVEEYKVSAKKTRWYATSLHHWEDAHFKDELKPQDGSQIQWLEKRRDGDNDSAELALMEGSIDALGTTQPPSAFLQGDKKVKRLFENYQAVEAAYFKKTKIFPIMHVLAVQKSVVVNHPDLPRELFQLFLHSKRLANEWLRMDPSLRLAWKNHYLDLEREIFHGDPWTDGLEANAHVIDKFLSYCYELGVSARKMHPKELFHPGTWDLTEAEG